MNTRPVRPIPPCDCGKPDGPHHSLCDAAPWNQVGIDWVANPEQYLAYVLARVSEDRDEK